MFTLIATLLLLGVHQGQCSMLATVKLYANGLSNSHGRLIFYQETADTPVLIYGTVTGLNSSSVHGFHIHANPVADDAPDCLSAGPHFNPYSVSHGSPTSDINNRHVGDLGNITTDEDGNIDLVMDDRIIQLYNETQSIVNRSVVIHRNRDDGGQGGFNDSETAGNAGARIICGLILLSSEDPITTTTEFTPGPTSNTPDHSSTEAPETTTTSVGPTPSSTGTHLQPVLLFSMVVMIFTHRLSSP